MKEDYKEIANLLHIKPKSVEKVNKLMASLDNKIGVVIYNSITTSNLTKNEKQLAFFFWGMHFTLWLQEQGLM